MKQNKELKKFEKETKNSKKVVQKAMKSLAPYTIDDEDYISKGYSAENAYSVFSTLDILNKNNDLFKFTKNTVSTVIKSILTAEEIKDLMEKTNCANFDVFSRRVHDALNGKNNNATLNSVAGSVQEFIAKVKSEEAKISDVKNFESEHLESVVEKRASGPHNLVNQVTTVYGTNRYVDKDLSKLKMAPLYAKLESDAEGINKNAEVADYVKNVYGYNLSYSTKKNPLNAVKRTLRVDKYQGKLDSAVNMLYTVAKTFTGSKKIKLSNAKKMISHEEFNEFLNAKGLVKKYNAEKVNKIFAAHKDTIKDVVATLTTIFMSRFVFEAPVFAQIERDLTEQACAKMKTLRISNDANEDYWINQFIEDRLKVNVNKVLAANNITNAEQLLEVYNKNGTVVVNPEQVTCLDDLVFSLQYNDNKLVKNKKLENLKEEVFTQTLTKAKVKNTEIKVEKQKPNKYLDDVIRKSDLYLKYLEMYRERLKDLNVDFTDEEVAEKLKEVKQGLDTSLEQLEEVAGNPNLSDEAKEKVTKLTAKHDAIEEVLDNAEKKKTPEQTVKELVVVKENADGETLDGKPVVTKEKEDNLNFADGQISMEQYLKDSEKEVPDAVKEVQTVNQQFNEEESPKESTDEQLNIYDYLANLPSQENENKRVFTTKPATHVGEMSDEKIKKALNKHYSEMVYGKGGQSGEIMNLLNYRIIDKSNKKTSFASDSERLNSTQKNLANKIRDEKIAKIIDDAVESTYKYYESNKDKCKDITITRLCINYFRNIWDYEDSAKLDSREIAKYIGVMIAEVVNNDLKQYNMELSVTTDAYKSLNKFAKQALEEKSL